MSILPDPRTGSATPCPRLLGCATDHDLDDRLSGALCHADVALLSTRSGQAVQVSAQHWADQETALPIVGLSVGGTDDLEFTPDGAEQAGWSLLVAAAVARTAVR